MIPLWLLVVLVMGLNFTLWGLAGLGRLAEHRISGIRKRRRRIGLPEPRTTTMDSLTVDSVTVDEVAVLMAAHNEEVVIVDSLTAITQLVPAANVHVVSDGSSDRTVELASGCGVNVTETPSNVGKAGALELGIRHFQLATRYKAVLLLDADTRLDPGYFEAGLPLFDDAEVVAVAGCAATDWSSARRTSLAQLLTAHRSRLYALMQRVLRYGQTWRRTNATFVVPGFASMYRAAVLPKIDINPPGLVIEDFNMTFEVYRQRLGKVAFSLDAKAITQDPDVLRDYVRQMKRWALGFWQTVRRFRPRLDLFTAMVGLFMLELVVASVMMLAVPILALVLALPAVIPEIAMWPGIGEAYAAVSQHLALTNILVGVVLPDFLLTIVVAAVERRPRYLPLGLFLLPLRVLDAAITLYTLPLAWLRRSTGRWRSPSRRGAESVVATVAANGISVAKPAEAVVVNSG